MTVALFKGGIASLSFLSPPPPTPPLPSESHVDCLTAGIEKSISNDININASLAYSTSSPILLLSPALWLHVLVKGPLFYIHAGVFTPTCTPPCVCVCLYVSCDSSDVVKLNREGEYRSLPPVGY